MRQYTTAGGQVSPVVPTPSPVTSQGTPTPGPPAQAGACSGTVSLTTAAASFSDGPGIYANSLTCSWQIDTGSPTSLRFSTVELEANYDFIKVAQAITI